MYDVERSRPTFGRLAEVSAESVRVFPMQVLSESHLSLKNVFTYSATLYQLLLSSGKVSHCTIFLLSIFFARSL